MTRPTHRVLGSALYVTWGRGVSLRGSANLGKAMER